MRDHQREADRERRGALDGLVWSSFLCSVRVRVQLQMCRAVGEESCRCKAGRPGEGGTNDGAVVLGLNGMAVPGLDRTAAAAAKAEVEKGAGRPGFLTGPNGAIV